MLAVLVVAVAVLAAVVVLLLFVGVYFVLLGFPLYNHYEIDLVFVVVHFAYLLRQVI